MGMKNLLIMAASILILMGCKNQSGNRFPMIGEDNENYVEEPDETFADYANAKIEPFMSFEDRERAILQQAANVGCQGRIWWYADSVDIFAIVQFVSQYSNNYSLVAYTPSNQIEYTLIPQGQDSQGNYVFMDDLSKDHITISADESVMSIPKKQMSFHRTTASHCNEVMTFCLRKSLYINHKYWIFEDFVAEIGKALGSTGIDADRDLRTWGNEQAVYVLIRLPLTGNYAFAEYKGWNMVVADGGKEGLTSDGSTNYLIANNSLNLRTHIQVSADGNTMTVANGTFPKINIKTATRLISTLRDIQDKNTTPQQFDQMYQTYANLAASKMQYINNLNVKEVYKFSARSDLRDAQIKMRQIRERALKINYQMQPSPYEGQDPSYDPGQKYQYERDGVDYGQKNY